ncbi:hexameric tyrosine-coordinated heme protein [Phormidesmis sp. 146-12]
MSRETARLIIKLTQPDEEKRKQLREVYGNDAMMLIAVGQTVATEFATNTRSVSQRHRGC